VALCAVIVDGLDNHEVFPEFCAKSPKWFRWTEICFVAAKGDETLHFHINDFKYLSRQMPGVCAPKTSRRRQGAPQPLASRESRHLCGRLMNRRRAAID
jgi:hypothetical protein